MRLFVLTILLIFIILFQITFLPSMGILKYLNLPFCFLIIYRFFHKKNFLFYTFLIGFFYDIFSISPKGFYLATFLLVGLIIDWLINRFSSISTLVNMVTSLSSVFIYQFIFIVLNQALFWLKTISWPTIFNQSYFEQLTFFIILNSLIIFLVNQSWLIRLKPKASHL